MHKLSRIVLVFSMLGCGDSDALIDDPAVEYLRGRGLLETYRPNSKLSGPARPLKMRYLSTEGADYGPSGDPAMAAMASLGYPRVDETVDETPTVPEEPDVSPYATDAERNEADDKANKDYLEDAEKQKKALKSAIAKEKDPEKKKQLQEDLRILEGQIALAEKYKPQAAPPRPASARAPLPKKPEEPKPWFIEGNAPDTVFDGTDPLSGLVPAATQIKGNVYPSHLEWEDPVPYTTDNPDTKKAADIDGVYRCEKVCKFDYECGDNSGCAFSTSYIDDVGVCVRLCKTALDCATGNWACVPFSDNQNLKYCELVLL